MQTRSCSDPTAHGLRLIWASLPAQHAAAAAPVSPAAASAAPRIPPPEPAPTRATPRAPLARSRHDRTATAPPLRLRHVVLGLGGRHLPPSALSFFRAQLRTALADLSPEQAGQAVCALFRAMGGPAMPPAHARATLSSLLAAPVALSLRATGEVLQAAGRALGGPVIEPSLLRALAQALVAQSPGLAPAQLRHAFASLANAVRSRYGAQQRDYLGELLCRLPAACRDSLTEELSFGISLLIWSGRPNYAGCQGVASALLMHCDRIAPSLRPEVTEGVLSCLEELGGGRSLVLDRFLHADCPASLESVAWVAAQALRGDTQQEVMDVLLEPGGQASPLQAAALFCALAASSKGPAFRSPAQQKALAQTRLATCVDPGSAARERALLRHACIGQQAGLDPNFLLHEPHGLERDDALALMRVALASPASTLPPRREGKHKSSD